MSLFNDIIKTINVPAVMGLAPINETSINKIFQHANNGGFIIISANRGAISYDIPSDIETMLTHYNDPEYSTLLSDWLKDRDPRSINYDGLKATMDGDDGSEWLRKRNKSADNELKYDIAKAGYSYSSIFGGYHEKGSDKEDSMEPSYIVYAKSNTGEDMDMDELVDFGKRMCKKYQQDSFYVQLPGDAPFVLDKDGYKINKSESKDAIINRPEDEQMYYTKTKRSKSSKQQFTSDVRFPGENEEFTPEKLFEGMYYPQKVEYYDRMKRSAKGEIFL